MRLSCRQEGTSVRWTVEITVDTKRPSPRALDTSLSGVIAVEPSWDVIDGVGIRVASYLGSDGKSGELILSQHDVDGIRKGDGIRAVRDILRNELVNDLQRALQECRESLPEFLSFAKNTLHLWKSPSRFHSLVRAWRDRRCDVARAAYEVLQAWELRDAHLYDYEVCGRGQALRRRRERYRVFAAEMSRRYKHVVVPKRNLRNEARFGPESDVRFTASPYELIESLVNAFRGDVYKMVWTRPGMEDGSDGDGDGDGGEIESKDWLHTAIERFGDSSGVEVARGVEKLSIVAHGDGGAWAARKKKKEKKRIGEEGRSQNS